MSLIVRSAITVIHNPIAGNGRARRKFGATLRALERLGARIALLETGGPGHARDLARECAGKPPAERPDILVVAGGDGTINEAANGILGTSLAMAVIPMGTVNLLAMELALPEDPGALAEVIANGPIRPIFTGYVGDRLFLVVASVGFDADAVNAVSSRLKQSIGKWAYVYAGFRRWLAGGAEDYGLLVENEERRVSGVLVANGLYYGGPFSCVERASVFRPELFACFLKESGRWGIILTVGALLFGRFAKRKGVSITEIETVDVRDPVGEPVQADGDVVAFTPVTISSSTVKLNVAVPA
jgi:diacylglycerol kinase family enzyme